MYLSVFGPRKHVLLRPSLKLLDFQKDDLLLCCSDGVWEFLSDIDAVNTVLQAGH